ncbi:hypothetical protein PMIN02_005202 [Paraphaeosphaeria minitans]
MADADTRSEESVDGDVKIGGDRGKDIEGILGNYVGSSYLFHRARNAGGADPRSCADESEETRPLNNAVGGGVGGDINENSSVEGTDIATTGVDAGDYNKPDSAAKGKAIVTTSVDSVGHNNANSAAGGAAIATTLLSNSNENLDLGSQTPDKSCSQVKKVTDDSFNTQHLNNLVPTKSPKNGVLGFDTVNLFNKKGKSTLSKTVKFKDFAEELETIVEEDIAGKDAVVHAPLQATASLLRNTPPSGVPHSDVGGYCQNAGHESESRTTIKPLAEATMPRQRIYESKYAPAASQSIQLASQNNELASQSNQLLHVGPYVQKFEYLPRAPRKAQVSHQPQHDRSDHRDETRMGNAQLRKLQQTLDDERKAHKIELERIEIRARDRYGTALQQITSDILGQRATLIQQTVHLKEWELDLNAREAMTRKIEHLLAIGQKQIAGPEADAQDLDTFIKVDKEIIREKVTHEIRRHDRQVDAQLAIKREKLNHREATIESREKTYSTLYKAQVANKLEAEIRADLEKATAEQEITGYNRGLAEGKALGEAEGNEELRQLWYDKGFAACHGMMDRIKRFQAGLLAHDSPELTFLFDQSHPDNPFTRGLQIGRRGMAVSFQPSSALNGPADQTLSLLFPGSSVPAAIRDSQPAGLTARDDHTTANNNAANTPIQSHPYAHLAGSGNANAKTHENGLGDNRPIYEQECRPAYGWPNAFNAFGKPPHPYASAYSNASVKNHIDGADATHPPPDLYQSGVDHHNTPSASGVPSPMANPLFGVPLYPSLQAQAQAQAQLPRSPTGNRTNDSVGRPNGEVSIFLSGKRLLPHGQAEGEDERVHGTDTQVNLIDLS